MADDCMRSVLAIDPLNHDSPSNGDSAWCKGKVFRSCSPGTKEIFCAAEGFKTWSTVSESSGFARWVMQPV
jgi:hypothetical protein